MGAGVVGMVIAGVVGISGKGVIARLAGGVTGIVGIVGAADISATPEPEISSNGVVGILNCDDSLKEVNPGSE